MPATRLSSALAAAVLASLIPRAFADKIIPCALGSGTENGCSYCEDNLGINVTAWSSATADPHFDMANAASKTGGGYDVWWNIPQPGPGCRTIITQPYSTDKGSTNSQLSGNVILSVAHGGCYFAHVDSRGVAAGFCCGEGDCATAGAAPPSKKRDLLPKRIMRGRPSGSSDLDVRSWQHSNPEDQTAAAPAAVQCSGPTPNGGTYTKAGPQQIDGQTLTCNGGGSCDMSPEMSISASTSLMNEVSTTETNSVGMSISVSAGFMILDGPMGSVTTSSSVDFSEAVAKAMSTENSNTVTKSLSLSIGLEPGANFNLWFTPTLSCQSFNTTCNGAVVQIEKCTPILDGNGNPIGDHGVMTVG